MPVPSSPYGESRGLPVPTPREPTPDPFDKLRASERLRELAAVLARGVRTMQSVTHLCRYAARFTG